MSRGRGGPVVSSKFVRHWWAEMKFAPKPQARSSASTNAVLLLYLPSGNLVRPKASTAFTSGGSDGFTSLAGRGSWNMIAAITAWGWWPGTA